MAALSSVARPEALEAGIAALEALGFVVRRASNLGSDWLGFAGTDQERLAAFHRLVAAPEVKAILFSRGGHGVLRLLPGIDWELLRAHPKAYVGYSDLSPLLLQIATRMGLICFHGPMVAADLSTGLTPAERESLLDALAGRLGRSLPCDCRADAPAARGPLLGGCLAMLAATLGTPWFPRLAGSLLFLEDVNEPLYRLDRTLTQLQLSGKLDRVKGMILGHLANSAGAGGAAGGSGSTGPDGDAAALARGLAERASAQLPRPVLAWNLPSGHGRPNLTLPLGAMAHLDPGRGAVIIEDDAAPA